MREIKFRVWDKRGFMKKPFSLHGLKAGLVQFTSDCPVMQYTGLKDINGVEIYEGDIVKVCGLAECNHSYTTQVKFENGTFVFDGVNWSDGTYDWHSIENYDQTDIEVLGNVHQNPELLETGNEH